MSYYHARQALIEVVENQLRDDDPPETRQALERLTAAGHSRAKAIDMIAAALLAEMNSMLAAGKVFDRARFKRRLDRLYEEPIRSQTNDAIQRAARRAFAERPYAPVHEIYSALSSSVSDARRGAAGCGANPDCSSAPLAVLVPFIFGSTRDERA